MAGLRIIVPFTATTGTVTQTLVQIVAPTNQRLSILRIFIGGVSGNAADLPVLMEVLPQTSAGTSSAVTPVKVNDSDDETVQTTARQGFSSTEPTDAGGAIVKHTFPVPTTGPGRDFVFPPGRELFVKGGTRMGIRANTPGQVSVFKGFIELEE